MPGVSAGKDGAAMMQPGLESFEMSPGACGSLKANPSLAMFRNMSAYMIGTRDGRSTVTGADEFWTLARGCEVTSERLVRAGMERTVVDSDIRCTPFVL